MLKAKRKFIKAVVLIFTIIMIFTSFSTISFAKEILDVEEVTDTFDKEESEDDSTDVTEFAESTAEDSVPEDSECNSMESKDTEKPEETDGVNGEEIETEISDEMSMADEIITDAEEEELTDPEEILTEEKEIKDALELATPQNGWYRDESGKYYYYQNGSVVKNTVKQINGRFYGFSPSGIMYSNTEFSLIVGDINRYYRAKEDGSLYVNEWFHEVDGDYYWYGGDGRAPLNGTVQKVGSNYYIFGYCGVILKNTNLVYNNVPYVSDSEGYAHPVNNNTWTRIDNYWYYAINGALLINQVKEINGCLYGFGYDGRMYQDTEFNINNKTYRAGNTGHLLKNEWWASSYSGEWFYYGSDGTEQRGWIKHNNAWYYLTPAMKTSCYLSDNGSVYRLESNGVANKISNANGLFNDTYGSFAVYYRNGSQVKNEWMKLNGRWFFFKADGSACRNVTYFINGKYYHFGDDGTMDSNGWTKNDNGSTYYATDSGALLTGEQFLDDKWYYFSSSGELQRGCVNYNGMNYILNPDGSYWKTAREGWNKASEQYYYYVKNGQFVRNATLQLSDGTYYFNRDGIMQHDVVCDSHIYGSDGRMVTQTGWYRIGQYWYYVDSSNSSDIVCGTTRDINGCIYGFDTSGRMITNELYGNYYFDEYGHGKDKETVKNGWVLTGGKYYYYETGSQVYNKWVDGYYIGESGYMYTNRRTPDDYYVGEDGKYLKNTIYNGYVIKENGKVAKNEWVTVNEKTYYANEYGYTGYGVEMINGRIYLFDYDGSYKATVTNNPQSNTWYKTDMGWTYVISGKIPYGQVISVNGATYYINFDGIMATNMYHSDSATYRSAYFGSDGKMDTSITNAWKNGYYFGQDHKSDIIGWVQVNGKLYHGYSGTGIFHRTEYQLLDGILYRFNSDGSLRNEVYQTSGWIQLNERWYYFKDGKAVTGLQRIKDKTYAFSNTGILLKNSVVADSSSYPMSYYFVGDAGYIEEKAGFRIIEGRQYYFDSKGKALTGIQYINGKIYYLGTPVTTSFYY